MIIFDFLRIVIVLAAVIILLVVIRRQISETALRGFNLISLGTGAIVFSMIAWSFFNSHIFPDSWYPVVRILTGYICLPLGVATFLWGVIVTLRESVIPIQQTADTNEIITAEDALTPERIRLYHAAFSHDADAKFLVRKGQFIDCNQKALELFHCSREDVMKTPPEHFFSLMQPQTGDRVDFKNKLARAEKTGIQVFECQFFPNTESPILTKVTLSLNQFYRTSLKSIIISIRDITSSKQTQQELAHQKTLFLTAVNSVSEGLLVTDSTGKVVFVNSSAVHLLGYSYTNAVNTHYTDLITLLDPVSQATQSNPLHRTLSTSERSSLEKRVLLQEKGGDQHLVKVSSAPILDAAEQLTGALLVIQDVSEQRRMEEDLWQAKKLESVGELAGKYAHDFNNILSSLLSDIALGKIHCDRQEKVLKYLKNAEKSTERARQITSQLLTLTTGGRPNSSSTFLPALLEEALEFALRNSTIDTRIKLPDDLHQLEIDAGQIKNVLHNIIVNAKEAIPGNGTITVIAENIEIYNGQSIGSLVQGSYVKIQISDNGVGIPGEYLSRVFEPSFSTKTHSNGLGLASAYSIVKNHGGHIEITSEVDQGTTVTIYLPARIPGKALLEDDSKTIAPGGKILVMDDEPQAREFCGELLEYLGHRVFYAPSGEDVLEMYQVAKEQAQAFDAVILDLVVPEGMGGKSTVKQLLEYDPKAKAIVSNGYFNDPVMVNYSEYGFRGIITKPYTLDEVNRVVREVLSKE